jgi:hypothetical protein
MPMSLIGLVPKGNFESVAVIGMAKNTGKTTTFNRLVEESLGRFALGLTTTGRDGEKTDVITQLPKPAIIAPAGAIIATTDQALPNCEAPLKLLEETKYRTQLGGISLFRVTEPGKVELVGPDTVSQLHDIIHKMFGYGAQIVLADGAFDRMAAADPAVTEAVILATGASLSPIMAETIARTAMVIQHLNLRRSKDHRLEAAARAVIAERRVATINEAYEPAVLDIKTALEKGERIFAAVSEDTRAIAFGGALVASVMTDIMRAPKVVKRVELFVADGTRLFVEPAQWRRFVNMGGKVRVLNPIHLLAVTVNPFSPLGPSYVPEEFLAKIGQVAAPLPVFDLVLGAAVNLKAEGERTPVKQSKPRRPGTSKG